ncbi:MAG: hypothetical protein GY847_07110 [Proteobacteria bacterium]|nr:hypothetical protein [Pseudomonadota bacterium]
MKYLRDIERVRLRLASMAILSILALCCEDQGGCPPGFMYMPEYQLCINLPSSNIQDGGFGIDAAADAQGDTSGSGLGVTCRTSADCEDYEADFCITDPMNPDDPGYCTFIDCAPGGCPSGWECCDCTQSGIVPEEFRISACFGRDKVQLAESLGGCGCV